MDKQKFTQNLLQNVSSTLKKGNTYEEDFDRNVLILFTGSDWRFKERLRELSKLQEHNISIYICLSFVAEKILDVKEINSILNPIKIYREEDLFDLNPIISQHSKAILPNITVNTLSKISLGILDTVIPNIVWQFLASGKIVYIDFSTVKKYRGIEIESKEIKNIINNYIEQIKLMGAKEITEENYIEKIINMKSNKGIENSIKNNGKEGKKVIVEKDIVSLKLANNKLIIPKNTIITPLAKDKARELNIEIIEE